ncbi:MAG: GntR family transcriptional regulator [Acetobacteraceae bacterium]|nr:GntR family transcriptional regulator [Acetobacteraceae bacterium]
MTRDFNLGRTNYQRVRDIIRQDIVTGAFQAGARLKISDLIERYGVSAMPIREALQQLQGEGLVVLSANKGASVRCIDERYLWRMYEIRKALETYFVVALASRVTPADVARLRAILADQQAVILDVDEERLQALDLAFHACIVGATGNEEAVAILSRTYDLTRPLRLRFGRSPEQRRRIPHDHSAIIEAIAAGDGLLASRLLSEHINGAFGDLADAMQLADDSIRKGLPKE